MAFGIKWILRHRFKKKSKRNTHNKITVDNYHLYRLCTIIKDHLAVVKKNEKVSIQKAVTVTHDSYLCRFVRC